MARRNPFGRAAAAELKLTRLIKRRLAAFEAALRVELFGDLEALFGSERLDAVPPFVTRKLEGMEVRIGQIFEPTKLGKELAGISKAVGNQHMRSFRKVIPISLRDPNLGVGELIDTWREENVNRITSIAGKQLTEVTEILNDAEPSGLRWEAVRDQIQTRLKVSRARATLIARDQTISLYGQINKKRQQNVGIEEYVWATSNDNRVRDQHADREGERFSWAVAPEDGHPGEAILCRCSAFPVLTELE